jgi:hypothetical protein
MREVATSQHLGEGLRPGRGTTGPESLPRRHAAPAPILEALLREVSTVPPPDTFNNIPVVCL